MIKWILLLSCISSICFASTQSHHQLNNLKIEVLQTSTDISKYGRLQACVNLKHAEFETQLNCLEDETGGSWLISTRRGDDELYQYVTVINGGIAFVKTGVEIPYISAYKYDYDYHDAGVDYKPVTSGFHVQPTLTDTGVVKLTISANKQSLLPSAGNEINTSEMRSTLEVPLNVWFQLAGSSQHGSDRGRSLFASTKGRQSNHQHLWLKVTAQ